MGRHRAGDAAPSRDWIDAQIGKRHRLSRFHDPSIALDDQSALLWLFPTRADVGDYAHRDEAYRNLGTSAALNVMRNVFADFDSYVLHLSDQRVVEHRPMRADDALHSDVFIETYEAADGADVYGVRVVFTDTIGALVFTDHATFVGKLEPQQAPIHDEEVKPPAKTDPGLAASS
ncbi:hypothetical protein CH289_01740 [Rhodococcus sp. RS1C4]|jgi:hypothetical protein|uniref:hypothetical protein n=1 Tax=unclassified Rhodococcus (in: high G+C Gram-positive bacteria) TaxID=192944 RepID=UPI00035C19E2|nr:MULTISPECIES: hypothetical protein [unclassified Rhodococcus (in: high G+C Gram-positive bacteria)]OZC58315.1 hypothetical protein CH289_01740 [Rhodococcus sp. RS1C4]OZF56265.1 hypothetical protein CH293_03500 [Rhodococcus sp. 14-2470-1b]